MPAVIDRSGPTRRGGPRLSPLTAAVLTFLAAASVLVLEIAAVRLLAPFVGVTLTTYTGIIGVILAGIAVGAWAGGRAADALGPEPLLGPTFVGGGLAAMAAVPIVSVVGALGVGSGGPAVIVLAGLGFVAPATLLSAVAPMIVRATLMDLETSGALVGRLSAIGTAGAITGTFLTGFVLLGLVPTRWLILGVGAALVLLGLGLTWRLSRSPAKGILPVAAILVLGGAVVAVPNPCERESTYYCIAIVSDPASSSGRTLVLDNLRHAYVNLDDPAVLEFRYVRWLDAAAEEVLAQHSGAVAVLHVGGGGFSFPRHLERLHPASRHTVLELDAAVVETARDRLGFSPTGRTAVVLGDARLSITGLPDETFDVVIGDAFGSLSVPWHLATKEFLAEVRRVMRPDGLYVMNLIDGPALGFVRAEAATLGTLFAHVAVIAMPEALAGRSGGNVVLVASDRPIDAEGLQLRAAARGDADTVVLADREALGDFTRGAPVLRDDFAPVDQLIGR